MPGWPPCCLEESLFLEPNRFSDVVDVLLSGWWVGAVKAAAEAAVRRRAVVKSFVMVALFRVSRERMKREEETLRRVTWNLKLQFDLDFS